MPYLVFHNPGVRVPRNLFLVYGASTKTQDEGKVGKFGSGTKLAAIAMTRRGISPIILGQDAQGSYRIEYVIRSGKELGLAQDIVEAQVNGTTVGVMGTLDAARNWDKPIPGDDNWAYKSVREIVQNHVLDEAGGTHSIRETLPDPEEGATTAIPLDEGGEVKRLAENLDQYILLGTPDHDHTNGRFRVRAFRKVRSRAHLFVCGMLVSRVESRISFDVDLWLPKDSSIMDEERLISNLWDYQREVAKGLFPTNNLDLIVDILQGVSQDHYERALFKGFFNSSIISLSEKNLKLWKKAFNIAFPKDEFKEILLTTETGSADVRASEIGYRVVGVGWPECIINILKNAGIRTSEELIPKKDQIQWVSLPPRHEEMLANALSVVEAHIPDISKFYPIRAFVPGAGQEDTLALSFDETIAISTKIFEKDSNSYTDTLEALVVALVHERDHVVTRAGDCTLAFRDEADRNLAKLMIASRQSAISCEVVEYRGGHRIQLPANLRLPTVNTTTWYSSGEALLINIEQYGSLVVGIALVEGKANGTISYSSKGEKFLSIPGKFQGDVWKSTRVVRFRKVI